MNNAVSIVDSKTSKVYKFYIYSINHWKLTKRKKSFIIFKNESNRQLRCGVRRHCRFSNPQKDHFRSEDCRLHRLHHNHHMNIKVIANHCVICFIFHKWQTPIPLHIHLHLKQPCLLQLHWTGSECEIFSHSKVLPLFSPVCLGKK